LIALLLLASGMMRSTPSLGIAEGTCRPQEQGPAFMVTVRGLKDRVGNLKLEVYPANDKDFLADDNVLLSQGKVFRRVVAPIPLKGQVQLCIRVPRAGAYDLSLLHDRDSNHKFSLSVDGIGFSANPKLHWSKPRAADARIVAGSGITPAQIILNYRKSLFAFGPVGKTSE
jgi:uncharacterized protein (DUF2141 family)